MKIKLTQEQYTALFEEWFNETDFTDKHLFTRNPAAKLIKEKLKGLDHWRNKKRASFELNEDS